MTDEQIRKIVQDEVARMMKLDRYLFDRSLQILDGKNIQLGKTTGTVIATEGYVDANDEGQKLGFFGKTPVVQPATVSDASGGATVDDEARSAINSLLNRLRSLGLIRT